MGGAMKEKRPRVLLTGASAGIGLATARALGEAGFEVWGTSRSAERLPKDLPHFHGLVLEAGEAKSRAQCVEKFLTEAGGIEVLINNAGDGRFGALLELPAEDLRAQFELLVHAPIDLIRLLAPSLRKAKQPRVVNVTSLAARLPIPFMAAYSASKAALASLTATLRMEAPEIAWTDVQPGDIRTDFNRPMDAAAAAATQPAAREAWQAMEKSMQAAPPPELVAARIVQIVQSETPPPAVVIGDFAQSRLAPLAQRLLPARAMEWFLKKHYSAPSPDLAKLD